MSVVTVICTLVLSMWGCNSHTVSLSLSSFFLWSASVCSSLGPRLCPLQRMLDLPRELITFTVADALITFTHSHTSPCLPLAELTIKQALAKSFSLFFSSSSYSYSSSFSSFALIFMWFSLSLGKQNLLLLATHIVSFLSKCNQLSNEHKPDKLSRKFDHELAQEEKCKCMQLLLLHTLLLLFFFLFSFSFSSNYHCYDYSCVIVAERCVHSFLYHTWFVDA